MLRFAKENLLFSQANFAVKMALFSFTVIAIHGVR